MLQLQSPGSKFEFTEQYSPEIREELSRQYLGRFRKLKAKALACPHVSKIQCNNSAWKIEDIVSFFYDVHDVENSPVHPTYGFGNAPKQWFQEYCGPFFSVYQCFEHLAYVDDEIAGRAQIMSSLELKSTQDNLRCPKSWGRFNKTASLTLDVEMIYVREGFRKSGLSVDLLINSLRPMEALLRHCLAVLPEDKSLVVHMGAEPCSKGGKYWVTAFSELMYQKIVQLQNDPSVGKRLKWGSLDYYC